MISDVTNRFLTYISYDTQSKEGAEEMPSTRSQLALAEKLAEELKQMGR